ncbi:hypothetical protein [Psychromonas sp. MME1]|uniref:hypothetical protein n=1 Tax=Psychromonas sp. MME1 TaxID=3231032 RepID=UPI0034E2AE53
MEYLYYTVSPEGDLILVDSNGGAHNADYSSFAHQQFVNTVGNNYSSSLNALGVSDYSNEIFLQYFVRQQEWNNVAKKHVKRQAAKGKSLNERLWNDLLVRSPRLNKPFSMGMFYTKLLVAALAIWLLVVARKLKCKSDVLAPNAKLCVVRSKASLSKLRAVKEELGLTIISEDIVYKTDLMPSMLSYLSYGAVLKALPILILATIKDGKAINRELGVLFGDDLRLAILNTYPARIVLKCWYQYALGGIVDKSNLGALYTGNKEESLCNGRTKNC